MDITALKQSGAVSIKTGGVVCMYNPNETEVKKAQIALFSEERLHPSEGAFVIDGAGEYEISHVFVTGTRDAQSGASAYTIFGEEGIRVLYLPKTLSAKMIEKLKEMYDEIDIIVADANAELVKATVALAVATSTRYIALAGESAAMQKYKKEVGATEKTDGGLSVKKKDLLVEGLKVVTLE